MIRIQWEDKRCARCRKCITKCPHNVLEMKSGTKGLYIDIAQPDRCSACGKCVEACCFKAITLHSQEQYNYDIYALFRSLNIPFSEQTAIMRSPVLNTKQGHNKLRSILSLLKKRNDETF